MTPWCRACGEPQTTQFGDCSSCKSELAIDGPDETLIGLVFSVRGRLGIGKRMGVCVDRDRDSLVVHFSAKEPPGRVPADTTPTDMVPADLGSATRLLYAAGLVDRKAAWDKNTLRTRVAELCADVRIQRRLVDDSLRLGWIQIIDWVPLSESEKAWRAAHHAATVGDTQGLRSALAQLPRSGYASRGELLLPYLPGIRRDRRAWQPLFDGLTLGVANASVATAAFGEDDQSLAAGATLLPTERQAQWQAVRHELSSGTNVEPPVTPTAQAWGMASLISSSVGASSLDAHGRQLSDVEPALVDDLIDAGRLSPAAVQDLRAANPIRLNVLGRLDPQSLTDDELVRIDHTAELARRCFLRRDRAAITELPPSPRVVHYQALLDVLDGDRPDAQRLDPASIAAIVLSSDVLGKIKNGEADRLPHPIVADPSLWSMFADQARAGLVRADPSLSDRHPLNTWIGMQLLLGLVLSGRDFDAVGHGNAIVNQLSDEHQRDEALNLIAFSLAQLGRSEDALAALDEALAGDYTENLLVNASIVASQVSPEIGVRHLARLVEQAPPDLQRAALYQAIGVWRSTDIDFPNILVPALRTALSGRQPIEDFLRFTDVAVDEVPDLITSLPNPGGELDGPYRLAQARAQFRTDKDYSLGDLADAMIGVYRSVGRPDWFEDRWKHYLAPIEDAVFVEFGEALGCVGFIDAVLLKAPELFTDQQRYVLAPQAGAHLVAGLSKQAVLLDLPQVQKFLLRPVDEFLAKRSSLATSSAAFLAENFVRCLGSAGFNTLKAGRADVAASYNPLVDRQQWDRDNLYAIFTRKREILEAALSGPVTTVDNVVTRMKRLGATHEGAVAVTDNLASECADWRREIQQLLAN